MDFEQIADQLYGLPLDEFVAQRDARAAEARKKKDRNLANQLKALSKPTVSAWGVNQLVRHQRRSIDRLLQIGDEMRQAQQNLDGDRLRDLSSQRRQLLPDLTHELRQLGLSDAAEQEALETLGAAVAEAYLADQVRAGRVTRTLQHTGFGGLAGMLAAAAHQDPAPRLKPAAAPEPTPQPEPALNPEPEPPPTPQRPREKLLKHRLETAQEALHEAQADAQLARERLETARERLQAAKDKLKVAEAVVRHAESERDEIQEQLDDL